MPHPRRDGWVLLALQKAGSTGLERVQVQKAMFLLGERRPEAVGPAFFRFRPWKYGPFSKELASALDELVEEELVAEMGGESPGYRLTKAGRDAAEAARSAIPAGLDYLERVVELVKDVPFDLLVEAVYQEYPEMQKRTRYRRPRDADEDRYDRTAALRVLRELEAGETSLVDWDEVRDEIG